VPLLFGCGCLALLLLLLAVVPVFFGDQILASLRQMLERSLVPIETSILENLPPDADPELVARLQRALERLPTALSEGQQGFRGPFHLVNELSAAARQAQRDGLSSAELQRLVESLESYTGVTGAPRAPGVPGESPSRPRAPEEARRRELEV
jgi:hypothetical protein